MTAAHCYCDKGLPANDCRMTLGRYLLDGHEAAQQQA